MNPYKQLFRSLFEQQPKQTAPRVRFERSPEWKRVREEFWSHNERVCSVCGGEADQIDHIKPKSRYPELALEMSNLRPICWPCNREKATRPIYGKVGNNY